MPPSRNTLPLSISCLGEGLKQVLLHEGRHIEDVGEKAAYDRTLRTIPTCPVGMLIGIEPAPAGSGRAKRPPSAYNSFVAECVGERKKDFRACAVEWKTSSKNPKNRRS